MSDQFIAEGQIRNPFQFVFNETAWTVMDGPCRGARIRLTKGPWSTTKPVGGHAHGYAIWLMVTPSKRSNWILWVWQAHKADIMEVMAYLTEQRWLPPGYGSNE